MHEPKDDEPRREKTRDFAPVGFSDVTLPSKTQTLGRESWKGERKRARKKWHSIARREQTQIRPPTIPASRIHRERQKNRRKNRKRHTLTPVLGHSFEQR